MQLQSACSDKFLSIQNDRIFANQNTDNPRKCHSVYCCIFSPCLSINHQSLMVGAVRAELVKVITSKKLIKSKKSYLKIEQLSKCFTVTDKFDRNLVNSIMALFICLCFCNIFRSKNFFLLNSTSMMSDD